METIDIALTERKTAHYCAPLVEGNFILEPDPAQPGRYLVSVALQEGGTEIRGYLITELRADQTVSLARISRGLDQLSLPTIHC